MVKYLDTKVLNCFIKTKSSIVDLEHNNVPRPIAFQIPFCLNLKRGDKITFSYGTINNNNPFGPEINHSNYITAEIYREKKHIASLNSVDMRILSEIRLLEDRH